jgi:eukaryotic-like serine/threonine-protein kinase
VITEIGKFAVLGPLGKGNFGFVFHVLDPLLDAQRAVKVIMLEETYTAEDFIEAFNEAKILEMCRHTHIVEIKEVDVYVFKGRKLPCITTEYLKNGSAQSLLEKQFVSVQDTCKTIVDVLFGLEHAHSQNIHHRDIKPGNILYNDNWRAKLSDFGLAFGLDGQTFNFAGYNAHLPPEVLANTDQDELSDIYSLGITFYRMINNLVTLDIPYINKQQLLTAINKEKFPDRLYSEHIPDAVKKIVNKAMKPNRSKRFSSCLAFRQAIQKIKFGIDWRPVDQSTWVGTHNTQKFTLKLIETKKSRYAIEFKRNERKVLDYCYVNIADESTAISEFYKVISYTTLHI